MTAATIIVVMVMMIASLSTALKRMPTFSKIGHSKLHMTSTMEPKKVLKVTHPAYTVVEKTMIDEYGVQATMYRHVKSGAEVLSIIAPDENKVFGITFRTPPADSCGLPHILEHSVLCGSRKYPSKEPFVDLLKGSLQTFLNAFTYPDRTCYPVASMNTKDFYNLVNVYLDAVLHPRAITDPLVLQQEGWHYELEDVSQPLTYKGVVYNEMKGVYSSPDSLMGRATQQALFPNNAYSVDSGGDPVDIPNLTFEQFQSFHSKYYHPSNARVYFYGDDDPLKRLELLDEYLSEFTAIPVTSAIQLQSKLPTPRAVEVLFPVAAGAPLKHMVSVNWLMNDLPLSEKDRLALGVLDTLLMGNPSSSLRKALTESQLGESVMGGLSDELIQSTFGAGLKGVKPENVAKVEDLVMTTLAKSAAEGFQTDAIKSAMNSLEFQLREFNTGSFPRGLSLMLGILSQWIYDRDPFSGVRFEASLKELKEDIASGKPVFQELIRQYLLSNLHRVTVEAKPDIALEAAVASRETELLSSIKEKLSSAQLEEIIESTRKLKYAQEKEDTPEAKASLPRLSLTDIEREAKVLPIAVEKLSDAVVLTHNVQSNGILYLDIGFDFSDIAEEDLVLLPLLTRMLTETGTSKYSEEALTYLIGAETGGIGASFLTDLKSSGGGKIADPTNVALYFTIRGKATAEKIPELFSIVKDVLLDANLSNKKRAVEMLKETKVRRESQIITSGQTYGASRLAARYSLLGYIGEMTGGLSYVRALGGLLEQAENDWPTLEKRLIHLRDSIVKKGSKPEQLIINLTGEDKIITASKDAVTTFLASIPTKSSPGNTLVNSFHASKLLPVANEGFAVTSQVNYVVKGGQLFQPGEKVKSSYNVVSKFLSTGYLWDNVRVMGGAYGGFARFGDASGRFMYLSYRDPNLEKTLGIYDATAEVLAKAEVSSEDMLQAVIGYVGDLDSPLSPDQKGFVSMQQFISGETDADRQLKRNEVIDTSASDFKEFAKRLEALKSGGSVVVFGSQAALDQANTVLPEGAKLKIESAILNK